MSKLINRTNKRVSLSSAAAILVAVSLLGQILGFLRYKLANANFTIADTDVYFAAFKIPDFFFFTIAAGALGVAFMPFLADRIEQGDKKGLWELSNSLLNLLAIAMGVVGLVILIFARPLVQHIVGTELKPAQVDQAVMIMRLIAFNPLMFAVSGVLTSLQQSIGRFFFFALAPVFYQLSIIASLYLFKGRIGIVSLGVGALTGALLQLLVVLVGMIGTQYKYRAKINMQNENFRHVLRQLPARSIDQGVDSLNSIVETNLAGRLGVGSISFYENAYVLHTTPTLLIGTTISTAAFPRLNERLAQGRSDLFRKEFIEIFRVIAWIVLPAVAICFFARGYFARLIFTKGSQEIATIFGFLSIAILFRTLYTLISRWFYSQKDNKTPLFVSLFAISLNILLSYMLSRPTRYGINGLAMAQSIVATVEVVILAGIMLIRDRKLFDTAFWQAMTRIISVTGFSMLTALIMVNFYPLQRADRGFITLGSKLLAISLVTILVHVTMSSLFGLEEVRPVFKKIKELVLKPVKI